MNRRTLLKTGSMAAVGTLAIGSIGCDKKDIDFYVTTVVGTFEELKPFLPNQLSLLSKGISVAKSFKDAYQDGKFDSATTLFENLVGVINDVINAAGAGISDSVKVVLAVAGVATRAIAVLMRQQATENPQVAEAVTAKAGRNAATGARKLLIERMADPKAIDALYGTARP